MDDFHLGPSRVNVSLLPLSLDLAAGRYGHQGKGQGRDPVEAGAGKE